MSIRRLTGLFTAFTLLTGCAAAGDSRSDRTLVVFAAASLTETFTALSETFETANPGVQVSFNFGGSSALAQQIVQGAPADVFAAASPATMQVVTDSGRAVGPPQVFARNRLTIAVPPGNPDQITGLADLANPELKVVLCAPQVPCGALARSVLEAAGVTVEPVSQEQDVKAALTKVQLGEADAALVYRTDTPDGIDFPQSAAAVTNYLITVLAGAPQPDLAAAFVQLVQSVQGQTVLTRAGFDRR